MSINTKPDHPNHEAQRLFGSRAYRYLAGAVAPLSIAVMMDHPEQNYGGHAVAGGVIEALSALRISFRGAPTI